MSQLRPFLKADGDGGGAGGLLLQEVDQEEQGLALGGGVAADGRKWQLVVRPSGSVVFEP